MITNLEKSREIMDWAKAQSIVRGTTINEMLVFAMKQHLDDKDEKIKRLNGKIDSFESWAGIEQ